MIATSARSITCLLAGAFLSLVALSGLRSDASAATAGRSTIPFDAGWRFSLTDVGNAAMPALNDSAWRLVALPHDWSAEGPFTADHGSGNGYAPGGIGWYRKHFALAADLAGGIVTIEFDGVYDHAEVWVNGHFVCGRPYGYSSFECPLTPHVRFGSTDNVVAVRVDHSRFADSRWYTGSGIYRHVRLRVTDLLRIGHWGTFVTTPAVTSDSATVRIQTAIENGSGRARARSLESEALLGNDVVARVSTPVSMAIGEGRVIVQELKIARPRRWTLDSPALYTLRQHLRADSTVSDDVETTFGVRTIRFDPERGFFLNDQPLKLKGVCVHHDAGSLGAAVPARVWDRRLRALKEIGVNAIRTSHNPPAPEFLDLCDRLGLLVKDEAFDEFTPTKNKWVNGWNAGVPSRFGYGESFAAWSVVDAGDMVRRDRNHPSIIAWSIGNEVDYPNDPFSHPVLEKSYRPENPPAENLVTLARPLTEAIRALDPTRPVTAALASLAMSDAVGLPSLLDVVGYNYQETRYAADHARYPGRVIFGSENNHQLGNWVIVRDNAYVAGQFLWTGIDYLGEAGVFPSRANGAGLLDLCAFKKPMAWCPTASRVAGRGALELAGRVNSHGLVLHELRGRHAHAQRSTARRQAARRRRRRCVALGPAVSARRAEGRGAREGQGRGRVRADDGRRRRPPRTGPRCDSHGHGWRGHLPHRIPRRRPAGRARPDRGRAGDVRGAGPGARARNRQRRPERCQQLPGSRAPRLPGTRTRDSASHRRARIDHGARLGARPRVRHRDRHGRRADEVTRPTSVQNRFSPMTAMRLPRPGGLHQESSGPTRARPR
jgi:beta-galactosidase